MKNKFGFILFIWTLLIAFTTINWINNNTIPPSWDQAYYLKGTDTLLNSFKNGGVEVFLEKTTNVFARKAPLLAIFASPFYATFGTSFQAALLVNIFFFITFIIFFFLLVKNIFNSKVAVYSVLTTSLMPLFYGLLRNYFVEFGLMTIVVVFLYFLHASSYLTHKKHLILLGLTGGLGILMKTTFPIFIFGPFVYILSKSIRKEKALKRLIQRIPYALIPALLIALPWYSKNIVTVLWHAKRATDPVILASFYYGHPFSLNVIGQTLKDLINFAISGYWFFIFSFLVLSFLISKKKIKINIFMLSWFVVPFLIFFFGPNKDYRLMLPLLPSFGLLIAWLHFQVFTKKGVLMGILILILPTLIYLNTTLLFGRIINEKISIGGLLLAGNNIGGFVRPPITEDWPVISALKFLSSLDDGSKKNIVLASEHEAFNINTLQYYSTKEHLPLEITTVSYLGSNIAFEQIKSRIEKGDYLILKMGGERGPKNLNLYNNDIVSKISWEKVDNSIFFPDGGHLLILKNPSIEL